MPRSQKTKKDKSTTVGKTATLHSYFGSPSQSAPAWTPSKATEIIIIGSDDENAESSPTQPKRKAPNDSDSQSPLGSKKGKLSTRGTPHFAAENDSPLKSMPPPSLNRTITTMAELYTQTNTTQQATILVGDWEMGDDEFLDLADDSQVVNGEDDSPANALDTCPVCGTIFVDFCLSQLQTHINACIDGSAPTVASPSNAKHSGAFGPDVFNTNTPRPSASSLKRNAFSVLMTTNKENAIWKEAVEAETATFKQNKGRRKAPFFKVLQGMPIAVDAFRYGTIPGVTAYFLTHAHSDHYTNLSSRWASGPIYCSQETANLIIHILNVDPKWVKPLPLDAPTTIPDTGGVRVTVIDANHCPGSSLFLFEGLQTTDAGDSSFTSPFIGSSRAFRYLHCGDFRATPRHALHPAIKGKNLHHVYLDTTYLDPKYTFPPQPQVISACAELAQRLSAHYPRPKGPDSGIQTSTVPCTDVTSKITGKVLIVIGTYSVGKERVVSAVAKRLGSKVYCDARKAGILRCQSDPGLIAMLTNNPRDACVHIVPLGLVSAERLKGYADDWRDTFTSVVALRPTGWTFSPSSGAGLVTDIPSILAKAQHKQFSWQDLKQMKGSNVNLQVYAVPYSEHSSFVELTCFALSVEWEKMIATVNIGSEASRAKMGQWFERWKKEKSKRKESIVQYRDIDYW